MQIESPCQKVCSLEPETGYCLGCGRSREEIKIWRSTDQAVRDEILEKLPQRLQTLKELRKKRRDENKKLRNTQRDSQ